MKPIGGGISIGAAPFNQAAVAITGGTIAGTAISTSTGVETVLAAGGPPLIKLSSGSVAANGAISAITALPAVYPDAYCWFPANALATSIAAGWYYCTFSTTTAGVAFLNTYTSGAPTIPSSPTAVTDGKGAFTGDTGEVFAHQVAVPILNTYSSMLIRGVSQQTNNADAKTVRVRWSGTGGTLFFADTVTSTAFAGFEIALENRGATNKNGSQIIASLLGSVGAHVLGTIDSSLATTLVFSVQAAVATNNIVMMPPRVTLAL